VERREDDTSNSQRLIHARHNFVGAFLAGALVVAFCLILLWHNPLVFWNDDYELSILPVFADMARSWSQGNWPILSPYSWVCGNLAGEFQYGVFSVFVNAVVIVVWKFPFTFAQQAAAVSIAHLFALAVGAFLLARDRKLSISLSIFVALIASLNGWIICWGASDWFGALGAFAWLPWAWWGAARALDPRRSKSRFLWPAPFVYLVVTGGFPYTVLMLLLLILWLAIKTFAETRNVFSVVPMLFGVALGFGLSAPAWLAILDLVQGSARELQPAKAHWQWLVSPAALPGFILPCWTVNWSDFSNRYLPHTATELACGLVAPAALIAGVFLRGRMVVKQIKWELILLLLVLLLSMVPTAGPFRWSFRWLPFVHLILAICAAEVLRSFQHSRGLRCVAPALASLVLVVLTAIAIMVLHAGGSYTLPLVWIFVGLSAVWILLEVSLLNSEFRQCSPAIITFCALLATYVYIPTNCGVPTYNFSQNLLKSEPLDPARLYLSIYPWAELTYCVSNKPGPVGQTLRPGSTSMWAELHFINGYSPIRPAGIAREFATSIHGEINPDVGGHLLNSQAGKDGELALLGVDGIVVARELDLTPQPSSEWELAVSNDEGRVFHRRSAPFARVRSVASIDSRPGEQFAAATVSRIHNLRNRVEAEVEVPDGDRPALLTFSRPYFRGYQARLGDRKLPVTSYRGLFPIVEVPASAHGRLALSYRPAWLIWGSATAAFCVLLIILTFTLRRQSLTDSLRCTPPASR
jgi:hypothetical protein